MGWTRRCYEHHQYRGCAHLSRQGSPLWSVLTIRPNTVTRWRESDAVASKNAKSLRKFTVVKVKPNDQAIASELEWPSCPPVHPRTPRGNARSAWCHPIVAEGSERSRGWAGCDRWDRFSPTCFFADASKHSKRRRPLFFWSVLVRSTQTDSSLTQWFRVPRSEGACNGGWHHADWALSRGRAGGSWAI